MSAEGPQGFEPIKNKPSDGEILNYEGQIGEADGSIFRITSERMSPEAVTERVVGENGLSFEYPRS